MIYPRLTVPKLSESTVSIFGGIDQTPACPENCFLNTQNTTSAFFPQISTREKRLKLFTFYDLISGLNTENGIAYTSVTELYYNEVLQSTELIDTDKKQIISMGSYLIVFPDGYYINTNKLDADGVSTDKGFLSHISIIRNKYITLTPCIIDNIFPYCSDTAPENAADNDTWLDTSVTPNKLYIYSSATNEWSNISSTHIRVDSNGIDENFSAGDAVILKGIGYGLDGINTIQAVDENCLVFSGVELTEKTEIFIGDNMVVTVNRSIPVMDYVCEHQNRLFGCRYGKNNNGEFVNEIYASKLGDPKNWNVYQGLSTDSYTASCGSEGGWTGITSYMGNVLFFKENRIHRLLGTKPSNFTIYEDQYPGIKKGSEKSLCHHNGSLFYHSNNGIYSYSGSAPVLLSRALGPKSFSNAVAAFFKNTYYICMTDKNRNCNLYTFDIEKDIWHRQDSTNYILLSPLEGNILGVKANSALFEFEILNSSNIPEICKKFYENSFKEEESFEWFAESGLLSLTYDNCKYLNKLKLRFETEDNSSLSIFFQIDSSGVWEECETFISKGPGSYLIEFLPPRCDHFRLKLAGKGQCKVYSLTKTLEIVSEVM